MKNLIFVSLFAAFTLTACVVSPGPGEYGGVEVSPLPAVVVLGDDPYYYQDGYFYYYHNNNWSYSQSRNGPWAGLPRSHWPNEVRHRDRDKDRDRGVMASPLPPVVVLGNAPYYYQDGYFYYYHKNKWRYSQSRNGPWADLPRSYWPKEVRHRDWDRDWDRDDDRGRGRDDNRDRDKGHDHDGR
jgi:hypothetical protein